MKKITLLSATLAVALLASGCTDAKFSKLTNFGDEAVVKCYSGTSIIYDGRSTGKVISEESSDGYVFKDAKTGHLMEVSGNCVIDYDG